MFGNERLVITPSIAERELFEDELQTSGGLCDSRKNGGDDVIAA